MIETSVERRFNPALAVVLLLGVYLLVTSAFFPLSFLSPFDAKRVLQLVLFTALSIFALSWTPLRQLTVSQLGRLSTIQKTLIGIFFLIGVASSLRLTHPGYALADVAILYMMLLMVAVTAASRELAGVSFDRWAVSLLAVMGLAVALEEFMGILAGWSLGIEFSFNLALMHFGHPRFYNQIQTLSIPALAALPLLFPDKKWLRSGCIAALGLQWFLVIMVGARGSFISLALAMIFIAFWLPQQRQHWLRYQLMGFLVGVLIYLAILLMNGVMITGSNSGEFYAKSAGRAMVHTSGRSNFWQVSVDDVREHPILGAGPTQFACNEAGYYPAHPHSFFFRVLGEWGLVALILMLIVVATIGRNYLLGLRRAISSSQTDPPLRALIATSLIAGAIHSFATGLITMPASQTILILMAGWALGLSTRDPSRTSPALLSHVPIVLGVLLSCTLLWFAANEASHFRERFSYLETDGRMVPRFWQHGKVCAYGYAEEGDIK